MVKAADWDPFRIKAKAIEDGAVVTFPPDYRSGIIKLAMNWLAEIFKENKLGEVPEEIKAQLELGEIVEIGRLGLKIRMRENSCRVAYPGKAKKFSNYITLTKDIYPGED